MKKLFILFIVLAGFGVNSYAQTATSATAKIVAAIGLTKTQDLNFGSILPVAAASIVIQAPDASVKATSATATPSGASSAAHFTVAAGTGTTYTITYDTEVVLSGTGPTMTATLSCDKSGTLAAGGVNTEFYIGGSLAVGTLAAQTVGSYSGTFNVSVAYN